MRVINLDIDIKFESLIHMYFTYEELKSVVEEQRLPSWLDDAKIFFLYGRYKSILWLLLHQAAKKSGHRHINSIYWLAAFTGCEVVTASRVEKMVVFKTIEYLAWLEMEKRGDIDKE